MNVPVIETLRLVLREMRAEDFDDFARIYAHPEVIRFFYIKQPIARAEAWRRFAVFAGHWALYGFGMWSVIEKASDRYIGHVGFHQPDGWPGFEIGWTLDPRCWGCGLATEAARAALKLAQPAYEQSHVISLIHPENTASIRVAEKIGETHEGQTDLFGNPVLIYGVHLPEPVEF